MRTLPLRLSPIEGESLPGYLARYSHTFQFHPGDHLRALGLEDPAGRYVPAGCYGLSLSPEQLARVSFVTGIQPDRLELMLLARYAGRAFPRSSLTGPDRLRHEVPAREVHGVGNGALLVLIGLTHIEEDRVAVGQNLLRIRRLHLTDGFLCLIQQISGCGHSLPPGRAVRAVRLRLRTLKHYQWGQHSPGGGRPP